MNIKNITVRLYPTKKQINKCGLELDRDFNASINLRDYKNN